MTPPDPRSFDEQLADRVRDAFNAYDEPVDEAALARLQASLGSQASRHPRRAEDRPPTATRRVRWGVPVAVLGLVLAVGGALWIVQTRPAEPVDLAEAVAPTDTPSGRSAPETDALAADGPADAGGAAVAESSPPQTPAVRPSDALATAQAAPLAAAPERSDAPLAPPASRAADRDPSPTIAEATPDVPAPLDPTRPNPESRSDVAALPPAPSVFDRADGDPAVAALPPRPAVTEIAPPGGAGVRLVVATASAFSEDQSVEGAGVSAGVVREWQVAPRLALSSGAVAAYGRYTIDPAGATDAALFAALGQAPGRSVQVPTQETLTTFAVEVPLDLAVDVARAPGGRVGASIGVTSALYLAQTERGEGRSYTLTFADGPTPDAEDVVSLESTAYEARETVGPLERLDLARQLNLGVGYTADRETLPLSVDVFARLPLGGLTSRDLPLTTVGVRLRYALW